MSTEEEDSALPPAEQVLGDSSLLSLIFSFLPSAPRSVFRMGLVCRAWRAVVQQDPSSWFRPGDQESKPDFRSTSSCPPKAKRALKALFLKDGKEEGGDRLSSKQIVQSFWPHHRLFYAYYLGFQWVNDYHMAVVDRRTGRASALRLSDDGTAFLASTSHILRSFLRGSEGDSTAEWFELTELKTVLLDLHRHGLLLRLGPCSTIPKDKAGGTQDQNLELVFNLMKVLLLLCHPADNARLPEPLIAYKALPDGKLLHGVQSPNELDSLLGARVEPASPSSLRLDAECCMQVEYGTEYHSMGGHDTRLYHCRLVLDGKNDDFRFTANLVQRRRKQGLALS
ncbi:hypothetical protein QOT17_004458 [Balamuthia mandrillaris]